MYQQIWYYMEFIVSYSELLAVAGAWAVGVGNGKIKIDKISPDGEKALLVDATKSIQFEMPLIGRAALFRQPKTFEKEFPIQAGISILQCQDNRLLLQYRIGECNPLVNKVIDKILSGISMPVGVALLDGNRVDINLNEMEKMQTILSYIELTDIQTKADGVHIYGHYKKQH